VNGRPSNNKTTPESFFIISTADFDGLKAAECAGKKKDFFDYEGENIDDE
jgi:hypothetical protein